jgi:predicted AAA+ superfamily ATPase
MIKSFLEKMIETSYSIIIRRKGFMNEKSILQILLGEFYDKLKPIKKELITREAQFPDAPNKIKVAMGMRRSGKTYFLYQHIFRLLNNSLPLSRILYIGNVES